MKSLSLTERDLSWGEYIRNFRSSYGNSYFIKFVNNFEIACKKESNLSSRIHFEAKKVMWVLTTNNRKLRDESTRSLYYYARKYPKEFLELLKYSLDINDQSLVAWCEIDDDLDINNYIQIKNNFNEEIEHEWILLKGHISQKNKEGQTRDVSIVVNAVLINEENYHKVSELDIENIIKLFYKVLTLQRSI